MLLTGSRFERVARISYNSVRDRIPARFIAADAAKARVYDKLTIEIARRALAGSAGGSGNSVDVGANCGSILRELVKLAPAGQHWAFEPIPNLAAQLRTRFPAVAVEQIALADYTGEAEFRFLPAASAYSSLLTRPDVESGQPVRPLTVEVRKLDDVIPAAVPIAFIKIDVEGGEASVLRGAAGLLRRDKPIVVFECAPEKLADCLPTLQDAGVALSLTADFVSGVRRSVAEVLALAVDQHEFYFVAGPG